MLYSAETVQVTDKLKESCHIVYNIEYLFLIERSFSFELLCLQNVTEQVQFKLIFFAHLQFRKQVYLCLKVPNILFEKHLQSRKKSKTTFCCCYHVHVTNTFYLRGKNTRVADIMKKMHLRKSQCYWTFRYHNTNFRSRL